MASARHVVVLGGGVVGVTSAWFLARSGCQVTLIERRHAPALETSFANGGLITPSMSDPWASPGTPLLMVKWLGRENSPMLVRLGAVPGLLSWGIKFVRQCQAGHWRRNTRNTLRLSSFSRECLHRLVQETGIDYDANARGTLRLLRDRLSVQKTRMAADMLQELGVRLHALDPEECVALEPALRDQADRIAGGIHYPDDEAGDAHVFTQGLAQECASNGVAFRYGETVEAIDLAGGKVSGVRTDAGRLDAQRRPTARAGHQASDLSGQGLLGHVPRGRLERSAPHSLFR